MARYCKREGCSEYMKGPCPVAEDCPLFQWDIDHRQKQNKSLDGELIPKEEEEQEELVLWCEAKGIKIAHIANERKCSVVQGAKLKLQGVRSGFPDNIIPIPKNGFNGLFIELKRAKKCLSKISPEQREWVKYLNEVGYKAVFCYGAEEAKKVILKYLEEK